MSLSQPIVQALENSVNTFIHRIAAKHGLSKADLMEDWTGCTDNDMESPPSGCVDPGELLKATKGDLSQMCKDRGIPSSGTKEALRVRLLSQGKDVQGKEKVVTKKGKEGKEGKEVKGKGKEVKVNSVLDKIIKNRPLIVPVKSEFGNTIHEESRLVFDTSTGRVRGRENEDGEVDDLTAADIDECNRFNLSFDLPENLDKKVGLGDIHIEGIDDSELDSEDDDDDDIVEEELLEEELIEEFGSEDEEEYEEYEEEEDEE